MHAMGPIKRVIGRCPTRLNKLSLRQGAPMVHLCQSTRKPFSSFSRPPIPQTTSVQSRIMLPDDANVAGNVHGGEILRMIDEAGRTAALRHCNNQISDEEHAVEVALARVDKMDFFNPMYVGDLATVDATVSFASNHSVEVTIDVYAENLLNGTRRLTNRAHLWYVAVNHSMVKEKRFVPEPVPRLLISPEKLAAGRSRYMKQKESRDGSLEASNGMKNSLQQSSITSSTDVTSLMQQMLPSHCNSSGSVQGGIVMKLVDNAAAVAMYRLTRTNVVTASIDALNLYTPIFLGNIVNVHAYPTYTSSKSAEIEAVVDAEDLFTGEIRRAMSAHLTFVSLSEEGKVLPIPQLPDPTTEVELAQRKLAAERYNARKAERKKSA